MWLRQRESTVCLLTSLLVVTCCVITEVSCESHRLYRKQRESTTISKAEANRKVWPDKNADSAAVECSEDFHFPQTLFICYWTESMNSFVQFLQGQPLICIVNERTVSWFQFNLNPLINPHLYGIHGVTISLALWSFPSVFFINGPKWPYSDWEPANTPCLIIFLCSQWEDNLQNKHHAAWKLYWNC